MKHRGSLPHRMDPLTDTTDKETNGRTNGRTEMRRVSSSVCPFVRPSLRWSWTLSAVFCNEPICRHLLKANEALVHLSFWCLQCGSRMGDKKN